MRALLSLVLLSLVIGCGAPTEPAKVTEADVTTSAPKDKEWPKDVAIYRNDKGEVLCPVMNTAITEPGMAVGHQDHMGKRYYFCCDGCPEKFKANPAQYVK